MGIMKRMLGIAAVCTAAMVLFAACAIVNPLGMNNKEKPTQTVGAEGQPRPADGERVVGEATAAVSETEQFDSNTPEAVLTDFIGMAAGGSEAFESGKMQDVFANKEYIDGYDEQKIRDYYGAKVPEKLLPRTDEETRNTEIMQTLSAFLAGFWINDAMDGLSAGKETMNNPESYRGLNVLRIDTPSAALQEQAIKALNEKAACYGATDVAIRTLLLEMNGKTFFCGATLYQYENGWKIVEFNAGVLLGTQPDMATIPMSQEEYLELIDAR